MYLRFISPMRTRMSGVHMGIFQAAFACRDHDDTPSYFRHSIKEEMAWFNTHLLSPEDSAFKFNPKRGGALIGICWFKSDARIMIEHAFNLRALLAECGLHIKVQGTYAPGHIRYADEHQVVAIPERYSPTHWG
ncbi:MAG: hypothetical protein ACPGVT_07925 [Maricaulaceae bacterium]